MENNIYSYSGDLREDVDGPIKTLHIFQAHPPYQSLLVYMGINYCSNCFGI